MKPSAAFALLWSRFLQPPPTQPRPAKVHRRALTLFPHTFLAAGDGPRRNRSDSVRVHVPGTSLQEKNMILGVKLQKIHELKNMIFSELEKCV
jgi:hypothetical protein